MNGVSVPGWTIIFITDERQYFTKCRLLSPVWLAHSSCEYFDEAYQYALVPEPAHLAVMQHP
jgi:hypothetical protein